MTTIWHSLPAHIPDDEEVVWVRRWWFADPWLATWSAATATFTSSTGLVVPWYEISRWRHQLEP